MSTNRRVSRRWLALAAIALIAMPALLVMSYVHSYAVDVPMFDDWHSIPPLENSLQGQLTFDDLWPQYNEHRILFPMLVMIALQRATAMDMRAQMYSSWALLVIGCAFLLADHLRARPRRLRSLLEFVPVAWLFFTLRQSDNLLWAWQIQMILCTTALIVSLCALRRVEKTAWLIAAVAAGIVCSFSFFNGLLVWPCGLLVARHSARPERATAVWCAAGTVAIALYLHGWHIVTEHPSPAFGLRHPGIASRYLLASVGGALFPDVNSAIAAGGVVLGAGAVLLALWWPRRKVAAPSIGPALFVFSIGTSIMLTVGRAGFGVEQALAGRYASLTVFAPIGIYLFAISNVGMHRAVPLLISGLSCVSAVGLYSSSAKGLADGRWTINERRTLAVALLTWREQSDEMLRRMFPDPTVLRQFAAILERHRLSVFAHLGSVRIPRSTAFHLDALEIVGPALMVAGWAVDTSARAPARTVFVVVDGKRAFPTQYGGDRPDVAKALGKSYLGSAFSATIPTQALPSGKHFFNLRILAAAENGFYEPPDRFDFEIR